MLFLNFISNMFRAPILPHEFHQSRGYLDSLSCEVFHLDEKKKRRRQYDMLYLVYNKKSSVLFFLLKEKKEGFPQFLLNKKRKVKKVRFDI